MTRLVEIRLTDSEGSVLADVNVSSEGQLVDMPQSIVAFRHNELTVNACREGSRSNYVASSVDRQLYVDNNTRDT